MLDHPYQLAAVMLERAAPPHQFAGLQPAHYCCAMAVDPPSHPRKPDEFYARVERYCDGPYVDLFAREQRPNWDCWGDQVDLFRRGQS
jgi:N6-adenosine-specific RNA methylase IME4